MQWRYATHQELAHEVKLEARLPLQYPTHLTKLIRPEDLKKWGRDIGHLIVKDGDVLALSSPDFSDTFAGKLLGIRDEQSEIALRKKVREGRVVKHDKPAEYYQLSDVERDELVSTITERLGGLGDPRHQ